MAQAGIDFAGHRTVRRSSATTVTRGEGELMIQPWQLFLAVLVLLGMLAILAAFVLIPDNTHQYF
jgi:hypothetical protein